MLDFEGALRGYQHNPAWVIVRAQMATDSIPAPARPQGIGGGSGAPPSALSVGCSLMLLCQGIGGAGGAPPSALRYGETIAPPPVSHGIGGAGGAPPSARIMSKFSR